MKSKIRNLIFLIWLFTLPALSAEIEWVAGETQVNDGDVVVYQGECYQAQNSPGPWETPSKQSTWFWISVSCSSPTVPPACPDGTELIDNECVTPPEPPVCNENQQLIDGVCVDDSPTTDTTAIPWVKGETQVENGDVVIYLNQCFEAKNSPGVWETPSNGSWFWQGVACPITPPTEPIICDDGSVVDTVNDCPVKPPIIECPDGSLVESAELCSDVTANWYVSPNGNDGNDGSFTSPFFTLKKALNQASPGQTIEMMAGRYQHAQVIDKIHATASQPIIVRGNGAVLDGSVEITQPWSIHSGQIYKTQLTQDIWQLFIDDQVVMPARWPNAQLSDGSLWDMKATWRHQSPQSQLGVMIDERPYESISVKNSGKEYVHLPVGVNEQSLAASGIDATGAIAILNIGSWLNWAQVISEHTPGSNTFTYSHDFSGSGPAMKNAANILTNASFWQNKSVKYEEGHYYLEGKLALLDSPNEWFFDRFSKTLYLWAPDGQDPNQLVIRGKTQTYGLTIRNSSHILMKNIDFFATAFTVINSHNITFDDIEATHYAYSKRMLGSLTRPETIKFINNNKNIIQTNNRIVNSYFAYTDGPAIEMIKEQGNLIDNNLIHDIDYSNLGTGGEGSINMAQQSRDITFSNNTFHTAGNSEGVRVGAESKVIGNHVYNTSLLQHDGAAINVGINEQAGTEIAYNWVHSSPKAGIRFDGVEGAATTGHDGIVHHNVIWDTNFSIIKGDFQGTYNNLAFNNHTSDLIIFNKENAGGINHNSETMNNLVGSLVGRKSGTPEQLLVPGVTDSNLTGSLSAVLDNLEGPLWGDFRPTENSVIVDAGSSNTRFMTLEYVGNAPDIGAYERNALDYWLPGHQSITPSNPVPFNDSKDVPLSLDLRFNVKATSQNITVFLGTTPTSLKPVSPVGSGYKISGLTNSTTYYWRVDTRQDEQIMRGPIWSFTTQAK
ncbi:hypothetical protein BS333_15450 [Vibrio azureus]|uniref:Chitin-binding type-3 domain-containing protein n=1 Tax=Vibrio azureus NBRC 104587 TaxID=1219077 RepID=U3A418_9VIBR|nr:DUF1565 domain-containing protein [Vibrio azureus]AUI87792.1 hypothetical protein BS333_15450 [Vibrio azureus]GAD74746.1 hypothetical protein VAZ01S_014_00340 [Vibrio azureus NBRC 104587]